VGNSICNVSMVVKIWPFSLSAVALVYSEKVLTCGIICCCSSIYVFSVDSKGAVVGVSKAVECYMHGIELSFVIVMLAACVTLWNFLSQSKRYVVAGCLLD